MLHYDKKTFNHTRYPCLFISPNSKLIPIHQFPIPTSLFSLLSCQTQADMCQLIIIVVKVSSLWEREREWGREGGRLHMFISLTSNLGQIKGVFSCVILGHLIGWVVWNPFIINLNIHALLIARFINNRSPTWLDTDFDITYTIQHATCLGRRPGYILGLQLKTHDLKQPYNYKLFQTEYTFTFDQPYIRYLYLRTYIIYLSILILSWLGSDLIQNICLTYYLIFFKKKYLL